VRQNTIRSASDSLTFCIIFSVTLLVHVKLSYRIVFVTDRIQSVLPDDSGTNESSYYDDIKLDKLL